LDKRAHDRHELWFPVRIDAGDGDERLGVGRNVSEKGLLVLAASSVDAGTRIVVHVRIPPDAAGEREMRGVVVRSSRNDEDPDGIWRHRLGIELDAPIAELDSLIGKTR
jgi:hypothetical protein